MTNYIITIGRQYGSGGHEIGKRLAEKLGVKFYDKELLEVASNESGISKEVFEKKDEKPKQSLLYSLIMGNYTIGEMQTDDQVFLQQFQAIKKIASQGPCVIVGRCADFALSDFKNCINVFVHATMTKRIETVTNSYNVDADKAEETIIKIDKRRSRYYEYYTNKKWGNALNYNLTIDTTNISVDDAVELVINYIDMQK